MKQKNMYRYRFSILPRVASVAIVLLWACSLLAQSNTAPATLKKEARGYLSQKQYLQAEQLLEPQKETYKLDTTFISLLAEAYCGQYRFNSAKELYSACAAGIDKKKPGKATEWAQGQIAAIEPVRQRILRTEDIEIIDSIILNKADFLKGYHLSKENGRLADFNSVFNTNMPVASTVFFNEKESKIYYAQPDSTGRYSLFSMVAIGDGFENEEALSEDNFKLDGDVNYVYLLSDGLTVYFSANSSTGLGGYDIYITRYDTQRGMYLAPERLNPPFNSLFDDYLYVIDEKKGVGWFATNRYLPADKVCVYTFVPNRELKFLDTEDEAYLASRAKIESINDTWRGDTDYYSLQSLARQDNTTVQKPADKESGFSFVVNDRLTYTSYSDFVSHQASLACMEARKTDAEIQKLREQLSDWRDRYSAGESRQKEALRTQILNAENLIDFLQQKSKELDVKARNLENTAVNPPRRQPNYR